MISDDPWMIKEHARIMAAECATKAAELRKKADAIFYSKRKDADALYIRAEEFDKECTKWCAKAANIRL